VGSIAQSAAGNGAAGAPPERGGHASGSPEPSAFDSCYAIAIGTDGDQHMKSENPSRAHCPVCGSAMVSDFYFRDSVPVTCASVFADAVQARDVACGNVDLTACASCGFAFNRSFDPRLGELVARYESSEAASPHFNTFAAATARSLVARHHLKNKTVLEVGCGDGDFLKHLMSADVGHAIGVDPLIDVARAEANMPHGVEIIPRLFDESMLDIQADALLCRHTLEHVPEVHEFLKLLREWAARAPDRVVLFDLPDAERVFAERAFWDIYYEHCNYFTAGTLRRAFEFAGFRILALGSEFQGQYLTIEAAPDPAPGPRLPVDSSRDQSLYRSFAADVRSSLQRCESALARLKSASHPLIVWQGSSKTVGFLSALAHPELIDGAVDVNPHRQGIFLPGSGLPVYAPHMLKDLKPEHVILMNPAYQNEVAKTLTTLGLTSQLHVADELLR